MELLIQSLNMTVFFLRLDLVKHVSEYCILIRFSSNLMKASCNGKARACVYVHEGEPV